MLPINLHTRLQQSSMLDVLHTWGKIIHCITNSDMSAAYFPYSTVQLNCKISSQLLTKTN